MRYCSQCGKMLSDGDKFCGVCGTAATAPPEPAQPPPQQIMVPTCTQCGAVFDAADGEVKFCGFCGSAVQLAPMQEGPPVSVPGPGQDSLNPALERTVKVNPGSTGGTGFAGNIPVGNLPGEGIPGVNMPAGGAGPQPKAANRKMWLLIGGLAAMVAVLLLVVIILFTAKDKSSDSSAVASSDSAADTSQQNAASVPVVGGGAPTNPDETHTETAGIITPGLGVAFPEYGFSFGSDVQPVDYDYMEPIPQWGVEYWDSSWMYLNVCRDGQWAVVKFDDPHAILIGWYGGSPMYFCEYGYVHNVPPSITSAGDIDAQNQALAQSGFPYNTHSNTGCGRFTNVNVPLNNMTTLEAGGKYGYYSAESNQMVTDYVYDQVWTQALQAPGFFSNGYCPVTQNGEFGFIDTSGQQAVPMLFSGATHVMSNWTWVKCRGEWWQIYIS